MIRLFILVSVLLWAVGCAVMPVNIEENKLHCELSSDKKTLRIANVAEETNTYYSVSGLILSPILIPTTAIISGSYVLVNNVYHFAQKKIKCGDVKGS
ncbi:hypothetical protein [Pseudoalteromonas denitrificans]|uniref:Lipoprotein n=1 Tax=Pseudoalteromonas denitrificans DSM 6059 TaxID=1123010 RepID=A0A1I1PZ91_9GAMM|nr:hypothetical protein [Pseudoalteromonas denitrificans]SFD14992.1 hypothetical protein SAMN02745724_03671 [Pseudoalteromonas denitrificans DSM 6059]